MVHSEGARVAPHRTAHRTAHRRAPLCVNLKYPHLESLGLESVALGSLNMDSLDGESRNLFRWNTIDALIVESLNLELLQLKSVNLQYLYCGIPATEVSASGMSCFEISAYMDSLHLFFRNVEVENNSEGPQPSQQISGMGLEIIDRVSPPNLSGKKCNEQKPLYGFTLCWDEGSLLSVVC